MHNLPSWTRSHTQCQRITICLDHLWNCGFFAIAMDPSLSPQISIGTFSCSRLSSVYKLLSQHASHPASERLMYSTSVDDSAMDICFLKLQVMAPFLARNPYPEIDLQLSAFPYKASAYPKKKLGCLGSALYTIPYVFVPARYWRMRFSASTCWRLGLAVYDANLLTAYAMSGLVVLRTAPHDCIPNQRPAALAAYPV